MVDDVTLGVDSQTTISVTDSPLRVMDVVRRFQVPEDPSIPSVVFLKLKDSIWFSSFFFSVSVGVFYMTNSGWWFMCGLVTFFFFKVRNQPSPENIRTLHSSCLGSL